MKPPRSPTACGFLYRPLPESASLRPVPACAGRPGAAGLSPEGATPCSGRPGAAACTLSILQEALTNIIKHANATEIRVATRVDGDQVRVTITDNGQGFAVESVLKKGGKGLSNQPRRAQAIGAEVSWDSNGAGTCFTLRLPIKRGSE